MLTIILTTYKEPYTIGKAIEQVLKNPLPEDYEILVTAPDDETLEVAKQYAKENQKIKTIKDAGQGKPSALNMVFEKAKGDILVLTDGDVHISENSIPELLKHFQDPKVGAVSGHPIPTDPKSTMLGYWSHTLTDMAHKIRLKKSQNNNFILCTGYLFAFRKNLLTNKIPLEVLDDAYISQEIWKKNSKIKYEPRAVVFIKNPTKIKDWIKQKKRNTFGEFTLKKYQAKTMRSFKDEVKGGALKILSYPKTPTQALWIGILIFARLYIWANASFNAIVKKSPMQKVWVRIESTK